MHADASGIRIHYRMDGRDGAPWVTFMTGIANDLTMWDGQIAALAEDFRLLHVDSRGHGGTQATPGDYSFDILISDLVALWDVLGIRQSHLVGLGLGGATAIGVALEHADRVLSLVPCCCRAEMTPAFAAMWPGCIGTVKAHGMEGMVEPTCSAGVPTTSRRPIQRYWRRSVHRSAAPIRWGITGVLPRSSLWLSAAPEARREA